MQIYVNVNLEEGDELLMTLGEAAQAVLDALGGDPVKDHCTVQATVPAAHVGPDPVGPPEPPEPPESGVTALDYMFSTGSPPPSDKQLRANSLPSSGTTAVCIDKNGSDGVDVSAKLLSLAPGETVEVRSVANTAKYMLFAVTAAPLDQGAYVEVPVGFVETGGDPGNGAVTLTLTQAHD